MAYRRVMLQILSVLGFSMFTAILAFMIPPLVQANNSMAGEKAALLPIIEDNAKASFGLVFTHTTMVTNQEDDGKDRIGITAASISVNKTTSTPVVLPGDSATFSISISNTGTVTVTNVIVTDSHCSPLAGPSGDNNSNSILDTNETWGYSCTVSNIQSGFTNTATVNGSSLEGPVQGSDTATVSVAKIEIIKRPDFQTVNLGSTVSFTITVKNTGDVELQNVKVQDPLVPTCNADLGNIGSGTSDVYNCTKDNVTEPLINFVRVRADATGVATKIEAFDTAQVLVNEVTAACPANMSAYWKLDEGGGVTYADFVQGHTGECLTGNCPTSLKGWVNNGQSFNSSATGAITVPLVSTIETFDWDRDGSFSIELWMKSSAGGCSGAENQVMIGRDDDEGANGLHWWLGCTPAEGKARFQLRDSGASENVGISGGPVLTDGQWHHLVAVRDGTADVNRLYVDGEEVDSEPVNYTSDFNSTIPETADINIGWLDRSSEFRFNGMLDEVAIYSRTLPVSEIAAHYNNRIHGPGYCGGGFAPWVTSTPVMDADVGVAYNYDVEADGDPAPTFSLTTAPAGMTIDSVSGLISWTPAPGQEGIHTVTVEATNSHGSDTQNFTVNVGGVPFIYSTPPADNTVNVGDTYTYDVNASGDPTPTYSLTTAPAGMTIDSVSGLISWTPAAGQEGIHSVTVQATNSKGSDTQTFTINVGPALSDDVNIYLPIIIK